MRLLLLAAAAGALASAAPAQQTRSLAADQQSPPAQLSELAWLAGEWVGEGIGGAAREAYSPPMGGAIAGHFVQAQGNEIQFYELITIVQDGPTLRYRLKHFNADLTGWEERNEVEEFRFVGRDGDSWYFDGLTIRRLAPDEMESIVKAETPDGTVRELVFRYRRAR